MSWKWREKEGTKPKQRKQGQSNGCFALAHVQEQGHGNSLGTGTHARFRSVVRKQSRTISRTLQMKKFFEPHRIYNCCCNNPSGTSREKRILRFHEPFLDGGFVLLEAGRQAHGRARRRRGSSRGPGAAAGEELGVGGGGRHVVVARRGSRRRDETPWQHRRERPCAGAPAAASVHPPPPFPGSWLPRRRVAVLGHGSARSRRHVELLPRPPGGKGR